MFCGISSYLWYMKIICKTCKYPKNRDDFYNSKNKSGHESSCKDCSHTRHYERRRERRIEQGLPIKFPTIANRILSEEGKKYCPRCKQVKHLTEFSTMKVRSGIASHCKECTNQWGRDYNKTSEGKQKKKESYKRNRDKQIDAKLRRKFGITLEQYKVMLDNQKNGCIICGRTPEENGKMLAVDHNHENGVVRDLLCNNCNVCIGFIEKNQLDTNKLKWYLERHNIKTKEKASGVPPY